MENEIKNTNRQIYLPLLLAATLALGFYLGAKVAAPSSPANSLGIKSTGKFNKLTDILSYIEHEYVDSVDRNELEEIAIETLLQELDPHSVYIPPADLAEMNEPLEGNFDGIGIEFRIQKDTITVINPITGGPSEQIGIQAGDRIVRVDTQNVAGVGVTNNMVMSLLRGERGTKVKVQIARQDVKELLNFEITRDKIPIYSVDVAYMLNEDVGYIRVARFAKTTYEEFITAGKELKEKGMKKMVLDLRGNGGGMMDAAVKMADEFLPAGDMIVYTEGKARPREEYKATSRSTFIDMPVVVLIDEGSASASEIVSGALQDNDRATIIGRRSFGKGLVQEPSSWPDGSAVRLTIARYYTPTGRCIQKPYENGNKDYYEEYYDRLSSGELQNADSITFADSLKYTTPKGKVVYGGGGIMPDVFVPIDTVGRSYYYSELMYMGIFRQFAFEYADKHRDELTKLSYSTYKVNDDVLNQMIEFAEDKGIKKIEEDFEKSKELIRNMLRANIALHIWKNEGFYSIINERDAVIKKSLEVI